jgi:6-phosphogluconolactonase
MAERNDTTTFVYVGGYTHFPPNARGNGEGIEIFRLNRSSGELTHVDSVHPVENPAFLTVDSTNRYLYAVNSSPSIDGRPGGAVSAFAINPANGGLSFLNRQPTEGPGPCHVSVDRTGRFVIATSYHAGNISVLPVNPDGSLAPASDCVQHVGSSITPERQAGPHCHSVNFDLAERFALVCDLGLDRVFVYQLDRAVGKLVPNEPRGILTKPGAGPRHLAFHRSGRFAFVINEIDSTLTSYYFNQMTGTLQEIATYPTLPPDFSGSNSTADVHVTSDGKFVYGSNRGHDSLAIYAVDQSTGKLMPLGYQSTLGRTPRNFAIDPTGAFIYAANQDSNNLVTFRLDRETGALSPTGYVVSSPSPTCVRIVDAL